LYYATYQGSEWSFPEKLPKTINIGRNQRHACFSPDGSTMYFSSNDKKGLGGFDLYQSSIDSTGNWGEAVNLGAVINTIGNEDSPFISKDGQRLYFASTGHVGYGNFDVFYCDWQDTTWSSPINAGKPINSPADDIYFHIVNDESETSLLSSSREGGFGQMDLYYFYKYGVSSFEDCKYQVASAIIQDTLADRDEYVLIAGADTILANKDYTYLADTYCIKDSVTDVFWRLDTNQLEQFTLDVNFDSTQLDSHLIQMEVLTRDGNNEEYRYCVAKEIFVKPAVKLILQKHIGFKDSNEVALNFGSKLKESDLIGRSEDFDIELKSVYFGFNRSDIRQDNRKIMDENIRIIKENPNLVIKIIGHTDKVGSKEYNDKLAKKRAKNTVKYLTSKGVSIDQIVAVLSLGEDEAGIRHKKEDGTDDIEKMQASRRVDFHVIGKVK